MVKTIHICGIGRKKGTSRTGKAYDFHVISGTYSDPDYPDGYAACEFPVEESMISGLEIGMAVKVFSHFYNGKTYVDGVIPV